MHHPKLNFIHRLIFNVISFEVMNLITHQIFDSLCFGLYDVGLVNVLQAYLGNFSGLAALMVYHNLVFKSKILLMGLAFLTNFLTLECSNCFYLESPPRQHPFLPFLQLFFDFHSVFVFFQWIQAAFLFYWAFILQKNLHLTHILQEAELIWSSFAFEFVVFAFHVHSKRNCIYFLYFGHH